jgi:hypothetical protein
VTTEIPTPVIDSIASILDQWTGGPSWRVWPSVAAKDQLTSHLRDEMKANGLSWADARPFILGMNKALALMEHFTGHPDGYRSVVMTVDLLKEKAADPPASIGITIEPPPN